MIELLKDVKYKDYAFIIHSEYYWSPEHARRYLQVEWDGIDSVTHKPRRCKGRKWFLSPHMTHSEVIQTALAAVLAVEEHEARESFLYKGQAIFGPHFSVDALVNLCKAGNLDVREPHETT